LCCRYLSGQLKSAKASLEFQKIHSFYSGRYSNCRYSELLLLSGCRYSKLPLLQSLLLWMSLFQKNVDVSDVVTPSCYSELLLLLLSTLLPLLQSLLLWMSLFQKNVDVSDVVTLSCLLLFRYSSCCYSGCRYFKIIDVYSMSCCATPVVATPVVCYSRVSLL
jgi:hypothetical protein